MAAKQITQPSRSLRFNFPVAKVRGVKGEAPISAESLYQAKNPENVEGFGSSNEGRLYIGLRRAGWRPEDIEVQTPILGGRSLPGGQVIDFVLLTPIPIPIQVVGAYWHRDASQEFWETVWVWREYGMEPVTFDELETDSVEHATQAVIKKLGRRV